MAVSKPTPWAYRKGSSPLHRLPAGYKLVSLLLLSLASFFPGTQTRSIIVLSGIALILVLLSFAAGIGPRFLLRGSRPLFLVVLAVFLLQGVEFSPPGFNLDGLKETAIFCARLAVAFAAGSLFFSVTTSMEIRKSLSGAESFLHLEKLKAGLAISMMLAFLPRFFDIWEEINLAWKSRGGGNNLSRLFVLIPLGIERMMIKAAETATALESRGALLDHHIENKSIKCYSN